MNYNVVAIPNFKREIKKLSKKFPSMRGDFAQLVKEVQQNPQQGAPLGNHCYKIRMAITSKGQGKSGGARVITYLHVSQTTVYLLSIYDKFDKETISDKDLKGLLSGIPA